MPDVEPPPRRDLPPPPDDEALIEAGLSPAFVNGGGRRLKKLILRGALAWREGDAVQALTLQAEAASLCAELALPREQILNLMVLGSYALAAGLPDRARGIYERAVALAGEGGYRDHQAQAELALGMLAVLAGDPPLAAAHYARAGRVAEEGEAPLLAIECWRMAGQLALDHEVELSAVDCWKRALSLADALEPPLAQSTSAAEVARALAALCRRRGLTAQAESLERQSVALEQGPPSAPQPQASEAT
jgi:tetratricopeptide (TPR) repeat protein